MSYRILLTGFQGTSAERLLSASCAYDTLLLPNDKKRDAELLTDLLLRTQYDYIICFGQKPNIKDKLYIESTARENGIVIQTNVDCQKLLHLFGEHGLSCKQSHNAGTSFCNSLYFKGLQFLYEHERSTGIIFVHIPFLNNMSNPDSFLKRILTAVDQLKMKGM